MQQHSSKFKQCKKIKFSGKLKTVFNLQSIRSPVELNSLFLRIHQRRSTILETSNKSQKQPPRGVPRKRCSENMQQIYRRTPMPKCDLQSNFIEIALRHGCSPVNLLHIFRSPFPENTSERLLLKSVWSHSESVFNTLLI